jgi:hypothetical protein
MTIEAWIWAADPTAKEWSTIISRGSAFWQHDTAVPNPYADFNFQIDDYGLLSFFMGNGLTAPWQYGLLLLSPSPIPARTWTHVAVTVLTDDSPAACADDEIIYSTQNPMGWHRKCSNPLEGRLYVNGEQVDADGWLDGERAFPARDEVPLRVGLYDNVDFDKQWFNGYLDEVRVWGEVKSAGEIQDHMFRSLQPPLSLSPSLRLYLKFDEVTTPHNESLILDSSLSLSHSLLQFDGPPGPVVRVPSGICSESGREREVGERRAFVEAREAASTL